MMKLENVSKKFKDNLVLRDINLNLEGGTIIGLVGRNGAGKTTIMKIICGNIVNYEGKLDILDEDSIGYLIEHPKFYSNASGSYNLRYFSDILTGKVDKEYIDFIIKSLKMDEYIDKKVKNYSLGMKQRLGIAISLLKKPNFLILDEPTNGMDPEGSLDVLTIIKSLGEKYNMGILISSHKLEDIEMISDTIVYIDKGIIQNTIEKDTLVQSGVIIISLSPNDIDYAYSLIQNDVKVLSVETQSIKIESIEDYSFIIKKLAEHNIFPKNIEKKSTTLKDYYFNLSDKGREDIC